MKFKAFLTELYFSQQAVSLSTYFRITCFLEFNEFTRINCVRKFNLIMQHVFLYFHNFNSFTTLNVKYFIIVFITNPIRGKVDFF